MNNETLKLKVRAVNRANAYAMELHDLLSPVFSSFVGDKVIKVNGGLMWSVDKRLPALPCTPSLQVYRNPSNYSLAYVVKVCETAPNSQDGYSDYVMYYETTVYIGKLQDGVLVELTPKQNFRHDYTVEEVLAKFEAYENAKKVMEKARDALYPFDAWGVRYE